MQYIIILESDKKLFMVAKNTKGFIKTFPTYEAAQEYANKHYKGDTFTIYRKCNN